MVQTHLEYCVLFCLLYVTEDIAEMGGGISKSNQND